MFTITKMPKCRWCSKEPEFTPTLVEERVCPHCGAMQDPVMSLRAPGGRPTLTFYVNPDDSVFFEVMKKGDETVRYILSPAQLQQAGAMLKSPFPLNGRFVDKGL